MRAKTVVLWDNRDAPEGADNTTRGLTHSLDLTKEGLAMKATVDTFPWHLFVEGPTGCWLWTGKVHIGGYGKLGRLYVHRATYEIVRADIPEGLHLDHLCRNRLCGNPWHLEPVTQRVNNRRGASPAAVCAAKTHCHKGHPFDEENTYVQPNGKRQCRICRADRWQRFDARRKAGLAPQRAA